MSDFGQRHAQVLDQFRVEPPSWLELREVCFEPRADGLESGVEGGEVVGVVVCFGTFFGGLLVLVLF